MNLLRYLVASSVLGAMLFGCASPHGQPRKDSEILAPNEILGFGTLYAENCAGCHGAEGRGGAAIALADPLYLAVATMSRFARSLPAVYAALRCRPSHRAVAAC